MKYIMERIRKRMDELGFVQDKLEEISGVSQATINRLINTPINSRIDTLQKVADALKVPLEYLTAKDEQKAILSSTFPSLYHPCESLQEKIFIFG